MLEKFKDDHQMFHSELQIKYFILLKNGKTKYCLRHQSLESFCMVLGLFLEMVLSYYVYIVHHSTV